MAGKRVGPNEYESALMEDLRVQESAAVGIPHEVKGETVYCYVVLKAAASDLASLRSELFDRIANKMGKALAPDKIHFVCALPKTRSGKILRGLIRKIELNEPGDFSAVENSESLQAIRERF